MGKAWVRWLSACVAARGRFFEWHRHGRPCRTAQRHSAKHVTVAHSTLHGTLHRRRQQRWRRQHNSRPKWSLRSSKVWTEHPHTSHSLVCFTTLISMSHTTLAQDVCPHHVMSSCAWVVVLTLFDSPSCTLHRLTHLPFHSPHLLLHLHLPCGLVRGEEHCALPWMTSWALSPTTIFSQKVPGGGANGSKKQCKNEVYFVHQNCFHVVCILLAWEATYSRNTCQRTLICHRYICCPFIDFRILRLFTLLGARLIPWLLFKKFIFWIQKLIFWIFCFFHEFLFKVLKV